MEKKKQTETVQIGNTTVSVISIFSGTVQLQHLIKRLIQKEIDTNTQLKEAIRGGLFRAMPRQPPWKYTKYSLRRLPCLTRKIPRRSVSPFKWVLV